MTIFEAGVLGALQGITEFLPISSSGHLILVPGLLGWQAQSVAFDVAVHVATLGAIITALWPRIASWAREIKQGNAQARRLFGYVLLATIPAGLFGIFAHDWLEAQRTLPVVGVMLIVWGIILYAADVFAERIARTVVRDDTASFVRVMTIGLAQAFALIPGTSRSGVTMSTALFLGFDRKTAANFSFLLAIPAILGAGLVTLVDVGKTGLDVSLSALIAGCITAFITGILAIRLLFAVIEKGGFRWFAVYRVILGLIILWIWYTSMYAVPLVNSVAP